MQVPTKHRNNGDDFALKIRTLHAAVAAFMLAALKRRAYATFDDEHASTDSKSEVAVGAPIAVSVKPIAEPAAVQKKSLLNRTRSDFVPYLGYHLLLNILTVDAINYFLEWTACQDQLIACCDPFNIVWLPQLGTLAPCMWLVGHTLAYMNAAYTYAGTSWERHANLAVAQVVWFFFEMLTFSHTYSWERITYYNNSEGAGSPFNFLFGGADGHPCPERPYFSTWIPIWQDFVYNTVGQVAGWLLFVWIMRRRRQSRGTEGRV